MQNDRLTWDDGMSVGIKEIDDDHKHLLDLITQLLDSVDANRSHTDTNQTDALKNLFKELTSYIAVHFTREENLMREWHYAHLDEHIASHQRFIQKIPELESRLFDSNSEEVAEEVAVFLLNWLTRHILHDDLDYMESAYHYQQKKIDAPHNAKASQETLIDWITQHFSLLSRIYLVALAPIMGVIFLGIIILKDSFNTWQDAALLQEQLEIVMQSESLVHHLQIERGLSVSIASSEDLFFAERLKNQRFIVDEEKQKTLEVLQRVPDYFLNENSESMQVDVEGALSNLHEYRTAIENGQYTAVNIKQNYSHLIAYLQKLPYKLSHISLGNLTSNYIRAFVTLSQLKEVAGQERAQAMYLGQSTYNEKDAREFSALLMHQNILLDSFLKESPDHIVNNWHSLEDSEIFKSVDLLQQHFTAGFTRQENYRIDKSQLFSRYTRKIEAIKQLSLLLERDMVNQVRQTIEEMRKRFITMSIFISILTLFSILLPKLLTTTIYSPIRKISNAMATLAKGNSAVKLYDKHFDNDMHALNQAYETCRRRILQGNVATIIAKLHQESRLKRVEHDKKLFEKLASIDPLTGISNRRHFFKLASGELLRSIRYDRTPSLLSIDIDYFKTINDSFGHEAGDKALKILATTCQSLIRECDLFARMGGEEFILMLPETSLQQAAILAERIRQAIEVLQITINDQTFGLTVSIGVSEINLSIDLEANIRASDQALYEAKNTGRNRVVCHLATI